MKLKEILKLAVVFTDQKDLLEDEYFLTQTPPDYQPCNPRQERIKELIDCFNLISNEIFTEYLPLSTFETVEFEDGVFQLKNLSKTATNVLEVRNKSGKKLKFRLQLSTVLCDVKQGVVKYNFAPENLTLSSTHICHSAKVPARVFAFGIAMEHFFLQTQSTEALIWENRYRNSLLAIAKFNRNTTMPTRRWI